MTSNGVTTADPRYLCGSWASCAVCQRRADLLFSLWIRHCNRLRLRRT